MGIYIRLKEILNERGISQKELAEATKIRPAAISEICNNQRTSINREHLDKIIKYLNIKDIDHIVIIEDEK